jgi:peptide-methionine (R)-S-oxide reductase
MYNLYLAISLSILFLGSCQSQSTAPAQKDQNMETKEYKIKKTEEEWKKALTPEQFSVLREKATERPFTGKYYKLNEKGIYVCAACGAELFSSEDKFDAGCGWPSFSDAIEKGTIKTAVDSSHGMVRTEIMCAACGGHLGHLFDDGPKSTGLRYCVNSASLLFMPEKNDKSQ